MIVKIVKDAMVLIHLAKLSLLNLSCHQFRRVIIPVLIHQEILKGNEKGMSDVPIILDLIKRRKILVKKVKDADMIKKLNQFNIWRGEAEAMALYWQEKASLLATDDDNVRKKKTILGINIIGTPAIVLHLFRMKMIDEDKLLQSMSDLRKIGWFSNAVLDKIILEVKNE